MENSKDIIRFFCKKKYIFTTQNKIHIMRKYLIGLGMMAFLSAFLVVKNLQHNPCANLLKTNIELLMTDGETSSPNCDIYKYNINQAESVVFLATAKDASGNASVTLPNGVVAVLTGELKNAKIVKAYVCVQSNGNCCAKSWMEKPMEKI